MAAWIKMSLGMEVGLGPGDFVLDGDPVPYPQKGAEPPSPIFGPFSLWPNGCMHQNATWYTARPGPRRLCVRWGPRSPSPKGAQTPNFRPISVAAKWLHGSRCHLVWSQASTRRLCVRWGSRCPVPKRGADPQNFRPMFIVTKRLDG